MLTDEELKEHRRAYYVVHRDQIIARVALWDETHPGAAVKRARRWDREHPERAKARLAKWKKENPGYDAKWHKDNPEKARADSAKHRKEHHEEDKARFAKWQKANPEKCAVGRSKRRSLKCANTPISELLTSTEWLAILAEADGHCVYCNKEARLTLDHVRPLSKGGTHSRDNVVPACGHCNSSKGNKTLEEWNAKRLTQAKN